MPGPASARASVRAASFSSMSPGSSRTATSSVSPAAAKSRGILGRDRRALLDDDIAGRTECAAMQPTASAMATGPNFIASSQRLPARPAQRADDLAEDRERDLGRRDRADIEPDRRVDAGESPPRRNRPPSAARRGGHASSGCRARRYRSTPNAAPLPARDRRSSDHASARRRRCSRRARASRSPRPAIPVSSVTSGKALRRREGGARIDDREVEVEQLRHRRHRLRDMHRAGDDDARRRRLHGQEIAARPRPRPCRSCRCAAACRAARPADRRRSRLPSPAAARRSPYR